MREHSRLRFTEEEAVPEAVQPKKKRRQKAAALLFEENRPQAPSKLVHQDPEQPAAEPYTGELAASPVEGTESNIKVRQRETVWREAHKGEIAETGRIDPVQPETGAQAPLPPDSKSRTVPDSAKIRQREQIRQAAKDRVRSEKRPPGFQQEPAADAPPPRSGALRFEENRPKAPSKLLHSAAVLARLETEQAISRENEDGNTGVEAAQAGGETAHTALNTGYQAARKIREHRRQGAAAQATSSWSAQKKAVRRGYARAKTAQLMGRDAPATGGAAAGNFIRKAADRIKSRAAMLRSRPKGAALVLALFFMLALLLNVASSCSLVVQGVSSVLAGSTYPSEDADMLAAEAAYCAMEDALQRSLDNYEQEHDYTAYKYDLDEIGHDPYVLISALTALHGGTWTVDEVRPDLERLFALQYVLTETETPGADGISVMVELKNNELSHLPVELLNEDQLSAYSLYMSTLGNRPDLFPDSEYVGRYGEDSYLTYDIPPDALEDEVFAAMIAEAEKYLGYPYVWGGSSPETSFDCSGFVCWVLNHSGWSLGRTTAQGLCDYCAPVRADNARPGDLVFFKGTYDTTEVSHVGIYVGNSMMIHCGDPITYSNLNSSYWQEHLYCYGRLP